MKDERKLQYYYFTFGQAHYQLSGKLMKDYWVKVQAIGFDEAQALFEREFAIPYMGSADVWAGQYTEVDFQTFRGSFPAGEYLYIKQKQ